MVFLTGGRLKCHILQFSCGTPGGRGEIGHITEIFDFDQKTFCHFFQLFVKGIYEFSCFGVFRFSEIGEEGGFSWIRLENGSFFK